MKNKKGGIRNVGRKTRIEESEIKERRERKKKKDQQILEHDLDFYVLIVYTLEIFCDHCIRVPIVTGQR